MAKVKTMGKIPRTLILSKEEVKPNEALARVISKDKKLAHAKAFVACPKEDYESVQAKTCAGCKFFLGYAPEKKGVPVNRNNMRVVCFHPIGRKVIRI